MKNEIIVLRNKATGQIEWVRIVCKEQKETILNFAANMKDWEIIKAAEGDASEIVREAIKEDEAAKEAEERQKSLEKYLANKKHSYTLILIDGSEDIKITYYAKNNENAIKRARKEAKKYASQIKSLVVYGYGKFTSVL